MEADQTLDALETLMAMENLPKFWTVSTVWRAIKQDETRRSATTPSLKTLHRSLFPANAVARFESRRLMQKSGGERRSPVCTSDVSL